MFALITGSNDFSFESISESFDLLKNFITGIKDFFQSFYDIFYILFPFFTDAEVNYFVIYITVFLGISGYLFVRKMTV